MNAQITSNTRSQHLVLRVAKSDSRLSRNHPGLLASAGFAALLLVSAPALAQLLGNTQSFAVLGGTQVTAAGGGATINGDVGVEPGTSITGPITVTPPFANHGSDPVADAARADWVALNGSLLSGTCTALPLDQLDGQTLGPGCHSGGALDLATTGTLTLTGSGIYIFRAASSLTTGTGSNVVLNGVDPCNVFWQVTSLATLNGARFVGTVVASDGVHLGNGNLVGRALAGVPGDVTMAGGNLVGGCSGPPITIAPLTLPPGTVGVPFTQTLTPSGGTAPITFTVVGGTLPPGLTLTPGGVLSGTPTAPGCPTVTIRATDVNGRITDTTFQICVVPAVAVIGPDFGVPTLSEWAMVMLAALLAFAGFGAMRRRAR